MTAHPAPPGTSRRSMRGRLLVVGSSPSVEQFVGVAQSCVGAVSRAVDIFDAIADISRSSDREPIAAVAVSSECPEFEPTIVIQAIQAVDRSVPVFLLYPRGDEMSAIAIREGYEDTIPLPAVDDDVRDAFAPIGLVDAPRDANTPRSVVQHPIDIDISRSDASGTVIDTQIRRALASAHPESPIVGEGVKPPGARDAGDEPIHRRDLDAPRAARPASAGGPRDDGHPAQLPPKQPQRPPAESRADATPSPVPKSPPRETPTQRSPPAAESVDRSRVGDDEVQGDLALVRCLRRGGPLRDVALAELRRASGLHDVRLVPVSRPGEEEIVARERQGLVQIPVVGESGTHGVLLSGAVGADALQPWADWLAEWLDLERIHAEYRRLSTTDQLTGALNRRAFDQLVPAILGEAIARRRNVSLMYFDIDDFKQYNDRFGHAAGDEVLREAIAVLRESIRSGDLVFRMGGDEFVVLFCDPKPPRHGGNGVPENIEDIAERCRTAVRRMQVPMLADSGPGPVTISAGCAICPWEANDADALLRLADERALRAKRDGKDHINFGPERPPETDVH